MGKYIFEMESRESGSAAERSSMPAHGKLGTKVYVLRSARNPRRPTTPNPKVGEPLRTVDFFGRIIIEEILTGGRYDLMDKQPENGEWTLDRGKWKRQSVS